MIQMQPVTSVVEVAPPMEPLEIAGEDGVSATWQPDPNEPRYCLCNDVSYGDMVGCDNEDVSSFLLLLSGTLDVSVNFCHYFQFKIKHCKKTVFCLSVKATQLEVFFVHSLNHFSKLVTVFWRKR